MAEFAKVTPNYWKQEAEEISKGVSPLRNVSCCPNPLETFIDERVKGIEPSEAEKNIALNLNLFRIPFQQEVSFRGLRFSTGGYPRFDFYFEKQKTVIEYQGEEWHKTPEQQDRDRVKAEFCKKNKIRLILLNKKHYYNLAEELYCIFC